MKPSRLAFAIALLAPLATALAAPAAPTQGNVVVIAPREVIVPQALPGDCTVQGSVRQVLEGAAFHVGQAVEISVPCSDGRPTIDRRPATRDAAPRPVDPMALRRSKLGLAHLTDRRQLIWTPTRKSYGTYGVASGYRVLDGVAQPLG
jgi:hypothetical protein